jgi:predicted SAM-dependent methyltransferase
MNCFCCAAAPPVQPAADGTVYSQQQFSEGSPVFARYKGYKFKDHKKALVRWLKTPSYRGDAFECPVCAGGLKKFYPIYKSFPRKLREMGFIYPLEQFETLNLTAYSCPSCDASDRERLYALFLRARLAAMPAGRRYRFIDFAPSLALSALLRTFEQLEYRTADYFRPNVDDQVDISNMPLYADNSVDFFMCSHILEHVPDDRAAMRELFRILRPGGCGIVMVPLIAGVEATQEDPAINTPELRWKHYAQDDHLRLYGTRDLVARLAAAGFQVRALDQAHFGAAVFSRAGIAANSVLYVVEKEA